MEGNLDLVIKIGSMALIRREDKDIDYNILSRLSASLRPGMALVTSGATEIGRLDFIKRTGRELYGNDDEIKTDYAAQGQTILMAQYRQYLPPEYSLRQLLVEHTHFNHPEKSKHIRDMVLRAATQGAIPIINYNDPVSSEENRKMEIASLRQNSGDAHECVDNDETAAVIAHLVGARTLLILTSTDGIYKDAKDPSTLVRDVQADTPDALEAAIRALQDSCVGASRAGAQGARAKLEYIIAPARSGTRVLIGHSRHRIEDLLSGNAPRTCITLR